MRNHTAFGRMNLYDPSDHTPACVIACEIYTPGNAGNTVRYVIPPGLVLVIIASVLGRGLG